MRAAAAGLSWPLPDGLDDEALRARQYPSVARDAVCVQPDWEGVLAELGRKRKRRRTRVTRRQLWVEYRDEARAQGATSYSYSRFCALLNERRERQGCEAQMRFDSSASAPGPSRPESRSNHAGIPVKCPRNRRQVRRNPQMPSSLLETAGLSRQSEHGLLNSLTEGYGSTPLRVAEEAVTRR